MLPHDIPIFCNVSDAVNEKVRQRIRTGVEFEVERV